MSTFHMGELARKLLDNTHLLSCVLYVDTMLVRLRYHIYLPLGAVSLSHVVSYNTQLLSSTEHSTVSVSVQQ